MRISNNYLDSVFDPDDLLDCTKTDTRGRFEVQGFEDEVTNIDPRLKIYTDCNDRTLFQLMPMVGFYLKTNNFYENR